VPLILLAPSAALGYPCHLERMGPWGGVDRDKRPKEIRKILRAFALAAEPQRQYASDSYAFA
jgi:hypothetical protein